MNDSQAAIARLKALFDARDPDGLRWNQLHAAFRPDQLATIEDFGLLTLTPDFSHHGRVEALLAQLHGLNIQVVAVFPRKFNEWDAADLYRGRVTHPRTKVLPTSWLSTGLFDLGTSWLLVCRRFGGGPESLQAQLARLKGSSAHTKASKGSLRAMSPLSDRCFSLIHCPDDSEGFHFELTRAMSHRGLFRLVQRPPDPLCEADLLSLFKINSLADANQLPELIFSLLEQGMALLSFDLCSPVGAEEARCCLKLIRTEKKRFGREAGATDAFQSAFETLLRLEQAVSSLVPVPPPPTAENLNELMIWQDRHLLFQLLKKLCNPRCFAPSVGFECEEVFRRNHISLAPVERHLLKTIFTFHRMEPNDPGKGAFDRESVGHGTSRLPVKHGRILKQLREKEALALAMGVAKGERASSVSETMGRLLRFLVMVLQPEKILELGTSCGYSTLWLASVADEVGATVVTVEKDAARLAQAKEVLKEASLANVVMCVCQEAQTALVQLEGLFQLVFLDLPARENLALWPLIEDKIAVGGLLVVDGWTHWLRWHHETGLGPLNHLITKNERFMTMVLPLEKGALLALKIR